MLLLDKSDYKKVIEPLHSVKINFMFARSVVENKVTGKIYVDNLDIPKIFYVIHPYGMTLLFGNWNNVDFNNQFKNYALNINHNRNCFEWMQAFPKDWDDTLSILFGDKLVKPDGNTKETDIIELHTRVNFKFSQEKFLARNNANLENIEIIKTDGDAYDNMPGSVVPSNFWDSKEDFLKNGIGYSVFYNGRLAATAYSAYIHDKILEFGIETATEFRGKGLAEIACSELIKYCLANNYEPDWTCRMENTGSYKLAQKIGFVPTLYIPYYRLSK